VNNVLCGRALRSQIKRRLLVAWDGARSTKAGSSGTTWTALRTVQTTLLRGYAPDLNPVEHL